MYKMLTLLKNIANSGWVEDHIGIVCGGKVKLIEFKILM